MKKSFLSFLLLASLSFATQAQVTPQPSPGASFSQTLGITKISVDYSRPGVKARTIFGGLLKYGEVWRTGANAATKIKVSNDIKVNGQTLKAGEYAILSFPGQQEWKVVFNTVTTTNQNTYDKSKDALTVTVKPYKVDFTETFTIDISDVHEDMAKLNIYWEHTGVSLQLSVNNEEAIISEVTARNDEAAGAFQQAAEYMVNKNMDLGTALEYIDKSIMLSETFRNTWIKSVIQKQMGRNTDALKMALKAQNLGANDPVYQFYKEAVEESITELRASVPAKN
ncbi:DUF2911 domain-containing protein [uncultured Arcticibacterium sp.]|uniref:DUF2911 domain-containing protein n=1 Tax=uncultured Arcticibacterium sp. TaxID=2173042 RepID=UPI0030FA33CF